MPVRSLGSAVESVLQMANIIYLVTQLDIPSLHSTQRFLAYMQAAGDQRIEVVVNRYDARRAEFDDDRMTKALGLPPKWKVPNDYAAVHRAANTGNALILEKSPAAQALRLLARSACGKSPQPPRKKGRLEPFRLKPGNRMDIDTFAQVKSNIHRILLSQLDLERLRHHSQRACPPGGVRPHSGNPGEGEAAAQWHGEGSTPGGPAGRSVRVRAARAAAQRSDHLRHSGEPQGSGLHRTQREFWKR